MVKFGTWLAAVRGCLYFSQKEGCFLFCDITRSPPQSQPCHFLQKSKYEILSDVSTFFLLKYLWRQPKFYQSISRFLFHIFLATQLDFLLLNHLVQTSQCNYPCDNNTEVLCAENYFLCSSIGHIEDVGVRLKNLTIYFCSLRGEVGRVLGRVGAPGGSRTASPRAPQKCHLGLVQSQWNPRIYKGQVVNTAVFIRPQNQETGGGGKRESILW